MSKTRRPSGSFRSTLLTAAAAVVVAAAGCGKSGAGPADGAVAEDDAAAALREACMAPDPGMLDFLDNMEDSNMDILGRAGRGGQWYTFHDDTGGTMTPDVGMMFTMEPIPNPRCGTSRRAMRVTGSGFSSWGVGFGFSLKAGMVNGAWTGLPYDASAARGVTFWARAGETSVKTMKVMVADQWSTPVGGHCDPSIDNGPTACYDHFMASFDVTTTWQRYSYQFAELQQSSFGLPRPSLDETGVTDVQFGVAQASSVFDIWVDDVSFFQ